MSSPLLPRPLYSFLFSLLGLVYIIGLFVPLMDNDAAHHANIALRIYQTGDYVNLIDRGEDYLDKPHLHFWLCAFSYKIFGVSGFAYKFPSFLFTILGLYSTYRLGKALYDKETGKLAALVMASAFAFILSNNDVRMDAILVASIAFASWQLVEFIHYKKMLNIAGAALGLALGFSSKGLIGVFVPALSAFFYILYRKEWKVFFSWQWLILLLLFALFISPVVSCYYRQFNLHPEKIVRGKDHINGVKFILFNQGLGRWGGEMGADARNDYLFFFTTFSWAFAPWSLLAWIAIASRIKNFRRRKEEWLCTGTFLILLLLISFSGSKLPHYLNIVFPVAAIMTAIFLQRGVAEKKWASFIFGWQMISTALLLLIAAILNGWAFPVKKFPVILTGFLLLAILFYFLRNKQYTRSQKSILGPFMATILLFFMINSSAYPQLLTWQGGIEMAATIKGKINPERVYFWKNIYSSSFNFYTGTLRKQFYDSVFQKGEKTWLMFDIVSDENEIRAAGYHLGQRFEVRDYEITKLDLKFLDPGKRATLAKKMVLAEISK